MRSLLTWFALSLVAFIVILGTGGMFLSNEYEVTRSIAISAERAKIHDLISNLDHWEEWGPWAKENADLVVTPGPIRSGVGASQSWKDQTGEGRIVFTSCSLEEGVAYDLYYNQDAEMCLVDLTYTDLESGEVEVVWTIKGSVNAPVVGPYFARMMDSMLGPMFQEGLENLKDLAEGT